MEQPPSGSPRKGAHFSAFASGERRKVPEYTLT
jgi:hypothetical protein